MARLIIEEREKRKLETEKTKTIVFVYFLSIFRIFFFSYLRSHGATVVRAVSSKKTAHSQQFPCFLLSFGGKVVEKVV